MIKKFEVSRYQYNFYLSWQLKPESTNYNTSLIYEIKGGLNVDYFKQVIREMPCFIESLSSHFIEIDGKVYQVLNDKIITEPFWIDLSNLAKEERERKLRNVIYQLNHHQFNLSSPPIVKNALIKLQENHYFYLINTHHIASDAVVANLITEYIARGYESLINGWKLEKPEPMIETYVKQEKEQYCPAKFQKSLKYWVKLLKNSRLDVELPNLGCVTDSEEESGFSIYFDIGEELSSKLKNIARKCRTTPNIFISCAFSYLLHRYSKQSNIVFNYLLNIRPTGFLKMSGGFVNTSLNKVSFAEEKTVKELIGEITRQRKESKPHRYICLSEIIAELREKNVLNSTTPFNVAVFETELCKKPIKLKDCEVVPHPQHVQYMYELSVVFQFTDIFQFRLDCQNKKLNKNAAERFVEQFKNTLEEFINNIEQPVKNISVVNKVSNKESLEYHESEYKEDKPILFYFDKQVNKTPKKVSAKYKNEILTYEQLRYNVNKLSMHLILDNLVLGDNVILYMPRSIHYLISMLSVLKSGGVFIPMDPDVSEEINLNIKEQVGTRFIITERQYLNDARKIFVGMNPVVIEDVLANQAIYHSFIFPKVSINDKAYIIFTSGSTGKPKGVVVNHAGLLNHIFSKIEDFKITDKDIIAQTTSHTFDASIWQFLAPLLLGASSIIVGNKYSWNFEYLLPILFRHKVTIFQTVPEHLHALMKNIASIDKNLLSNVRIMIMNGEALPTGYCQRWFNLFPNKKLGNCYGITECSDDVSHITYRNNKDIENELRFVSMGKPIRKTQFYILDDDLNLVPPGVVGELYIGGISLALGYLNNPELTHGKFIDNPFVSKDKKNNSKLYKTGDLARQLDNQRFEYIGRNDFQVKIRGYRIELGEIETKIGKIRGITQVLVMARDITDKNTGDKYLVAYYTSSKEITEREIKNTVSETLPEYMIPRTFIQLKSFPLNSNGKIDRARLPEVNLSNKKEYVAPSSDDEIAICNLWKQQFNTEKIGITDNFFSLGGHSIMAINISYETSKLLNKKVSVGDIFKYKTIKKIIAHCNEDLISIPPAGLNTAALSYAQERLWFIEQYENGTCAYHLPAIFEISNDIDLEELRKSLISVVERHSILRTVFCEDESGEDYQRVESKKLLIVEKEFSSKKEMSNEVKEIIQKPFELRSDFPIRVYICFLGNTRYLVVNVHHIAFDGWSYRVFINDLMCFYKQKSLPELKIQYIDYSVWQRAYLSGDVYHKQIKFWQEKLSGYEELELPTDKPRPNKVCYKGESCHFEISKQLSNKLRDLAKTNQTTIYNVLLSGFYILLNKYSGQKDIIVGSPIANRQYKDIKNLVGFFANTIALRIQLDSNSTFRSLLKSIHNNMSDAQENQEIPFEHLVSEIVKKRDLSRHPIFQVMFSEQGFGIGEEFSGLKPKLFDQIEISRFDLSLLIDESQESISAKLIYSTSLYETATIKRLIEYYKNILVEAAYVDKPIKNYQICSKEEIDFITKDVNSTQVLFEKNKALHRLFEEQAELSPESIALVFDSHQLSYNELNKKANQFARLIKENYQNVIGKPFQSDTLILVCLEKGIDIIVVILAILKAGGAYVPIDPKSPKGRANYILEDTNSKMIITQSSLQNVVCSGGDKKVKSIVIDKCNYNKYDDANLKNVSNSKNIAYVIYTSGTTGRPKGILISHQNCVNYISWMNRELNNMNYDCSSSFGFDATVQVLWVPLLKGNAVYVCQDNVKRDVLKYVKYLYEHNIEVIKLTPTYLKSCINVLEEESKNLSLKTIVVGGEPIDNSDIKKLGTVFKGIKIMLHYGPTETTVGSLMKWWDKSDLLPPNILGKAQHNTRCYILTNAQEVVPIGGIGELCISGVGVSIGYLNNPELTKENFIDNPFATDEDKSEYYGKLYKTGDLARYLPDGNIEYIGRKDFQVKIRGYRVELAEIEAVICRYETISQAVVLIQAQEKTSDKILVAYYVSKQEIDSAVLSNYLSEHLPEYMVVHHFKYLENIPLTVNGKINRDALPYVSIEDNSVEYLPPQTEVEFKITKEWEAVLGIEKIGVKDDFFKLGGSSILAIQLSHRISKKFDCQFNVAEIFKKPTISRQAKIIHLLPKKIKINKVSEGALANISFAEERLWFIEQYKGGTDAYHIPMLLELNSDIQIEKFKQSLRCVIRRHRRLETIIQPQINGKATYKYIKDIVIFEEIDTQEQSLNSILKQEIKKPFELSVSAPLRVVFFKTEHRLVVLMLAHHMAVDGWSVNIYIRDLLSYYLHLTDSKPLNLPNLSIDYSDFSVWQRQYLNEEIIESQKAYWLRQLEGFETLQISTDYPRPKEISYNGRTLEFELSSEITLGLKQLANNNQTTLYTVLLSVYYVLLRRYSNQDDIVVGTPVANRHYPQVENVIGSFVNILVLRVILNKNLNVNNLIRKVHFALLDAHENQDLPFEKLVEELDLEKDTSRYPVVQVSFDVDFDRETVNNQQYIFEKIGKPIRIEELGSSAQFDLTLRFSLINNTLIGNLNYSTALFDSSTIKRLTTHFVNLANEFVSKQDGEIATLSMLTHKEYDLLVNHYNHTEEPYPKSRSFIQLFIDVAQEKSRAIATIDGVNKLSYYDLDRKSDIVCVWLMKNGLKKNDSVTFYLERSNNYLICMLGVWKAGGCFVPLNPSAGLSVNERVLKQVDSKYIFTDRKFLSDFSSKESKEVLITIEELLSTSINEKPTQVNLSNNDLAYIIFTSGSTGQPKGVMVKHQGMLNHIFAKIKSFSITEKDIIAQTATQTFDVSIWQFITALIVGGKVSILNDESAWQPDKLMPRIEQDNISILESVPSHFSILLKYLSHKKSLYSLKSLRYLIMNGESLPAGYCKSFFNLYPSVNLANVYGPTECSDDITHYLFSNKDSLTGSMVPIGRPIQNTKLYILDDNKQVVPQGVVGELYVAGAGVGLGYLKDKSKTESSFIDNFFANKKDSENGYNKLYRTGDLVRYLRDGNIEYIGRKDNQVKIRGVRIELGEIESVLINHKHISQAVVLTQSTSEVSSDLNQTLVAYYVSDISLSDESLINYLATCLPEYMVVHNFMRLEKMLLTENGKINKKALPPLQLQDKIARYVSARTKSEEKLCLIWAAILEQENIGVEDNFFKRGGSSILAIQLSHRISEEFNCQFNVADVFKYPTIEKQAQHLHQLPRQLLLQKKALKQARLSYAEERLWFIEQYEEGTDAYHIPMLLELNADIKTTELKQSLMNVINRHKRLTMTIQRQSDGSAVYKSVEDKVLFKEVNVKEQSLESEIMKEFIKPFDLSVSAPIRMKLYKTERRHVALVMVHHIAFDGWSINIFLRDLLAFYLHLTEGKPVNLPNLSIDYIDFAVWQREHLNGIILESQKEYWLNQLSGFEILQIPTDYSRPKEVCYQGGNIEFEFDRETTQALEQLANKNQTTLYTVLLSIYYVLLNRYSNQDDIVIGVPVANRHYPQVENVIGFFVNTLVLRKTLKGNENCNDWIKQVHYMMIDAQSHQDFPFERLLDLLELKQDLSRHPIFQVSFDADINERKEQKSKAAITKLGKPISIKNFYLTARFDLTLKFVKEGDKLCGNMNYATALFKKETVQGMINCYKTLLKGFINPENQVVSKLPLVSVKDLPGILKQDEKLNSISNKETLFYQLFEEQVSLSSNKTAVIFDNESLTYSELCHRVEKVSNYLIHNGVAVGDDVVLYMPRSINYLISVLAVLRSGAGFVPMNPDFAANYNEEIIRQLQNKFFLTDGDKSDKLNCMSKAGVVINIQNILAQKFIIESARPKVESTSKAYTIFTSGSTGKPKGVIVNHAGLINHVLSKINDFQITCSDHVAQTTTHTFDASIWQFIAPLLLGGRTVIVNNRCSWDYQYLLPIFEQCKVTVFQTVPEHLYTLINHIKDSDMHYLKTLRIVIMNGEALPVKYCEKWFELFPSIKLGNCYGVTECSDDVSHATYNSVNDLNKELRYVEIGKPIKNTTFYILDNYLNLTPVGVQGELYIGGVSLAVGYLNKPELTNEKFINNPFVKCNVESGNSDKLYKTGDLVRCLANGKIEYIGRKDFQVKINGVRIELGEIESLLTSHPEVSQSVVLSQTLVNKDNKSQKVLVAYYVSEKDLSRQELSDYISKQLPDYMSIQYFVRLDLIPLNSNGKIDRKSLPLVEVDEVSLKHISPRTDLENKIHSVWKGVLALDDICVEANFFQLGGSSLLAIQLSHRLSEALSCQFSVANVFKFPTIAKQSEQIHLLPKQFHIERRTKDKVQLSYSEERLWFIEQYEGGSDAYHIPMVLELNPDINVDFLKQSLQLLTRRHKRLRTAISIQSDGSVIYQSLNENLSFNSFYISEAQLEHALSEEIAKPFELTGSFPLRVHFYHIDKRTILLMMVHHLAFDGWSTDIFLRDLRAYYLNLKDNRPLNLPELSIDYMDFAVWQREYFKGNILEQQKKYWLHQLLGFETLQLPTDFIRPKDVSYKGQDFYFELNEEVTKSLEALANKNNTTLYTVLLSIYYILLGRYSNQNDIVIGVPVANRHYPQIENVIGMFVNTLVLRSRLNDKMLIDEWISYIHTMLVDAQSHQDFPFEKLIELLKVEKDTSRHPIFQVVFDANVIKQESNIREKSISMFGKHLNEKPVDTIAKHDLTLIFTREGNTLIGNLNFASSLFKISTIKSMADHFKSLAEGIVLKKNQMIKGISIIPSTEYERLISERSNSDISYPKDKTIAQLFEEQVENVPDKIALVFEDQKLTYKELNQKANQLARAIRQKYREQTDKELLPDTLIALCLERSLEVVISILAVLKAGGAYVPISPSYPHSRINYILEDTSSHVVLTKSKLGESIISLCGADITSIFVDDFNTEKYDTKNLENKSKSSDLAYVIYTSGTTGLPKGVLIEQMSVINLALSQKNKLNVDKNSRVLQFSSISFDAFTWELYSTLFSQACLYIPNSQQKSEGQVLSEYIQTHNISIATLPPSYLQVMSPSLTKNLKTLIVAGEASNSHTMNEWSLHRQVINAYGPTESTVCSMMHKYMVGDLATNIGKPLSNIKQYVLDDNGAPVFWGAIGELYISGASLSRGYLNKPELTHEKFIDNLFASKEDKTIDYNKLYKTGDLVRYLPDGSIEYIGRKDSQVKIRGFRIELGEIEAKLCQFDSISQAIVLTQNRSTTGDQVLIAYYVSDKDIDAQILINYLLENLPDYMVVYHFKRLDAIPLTVNGKLNKSALPIIEIEDTAIAYKAPKTELEILLCKIWQEVLEVEQIGLSDNFFKLGGNSILAAQLCNKMTEHLKKRVQIADLFKKQSIEGLLLSLELEADNTDVDGDELEI